MTFVQFILLMCAVSVAVRLAPPIPERHRTTASAVVAIVFLFIAPAILSDYRLFQLSTVAIWAIVAMGLNMLSGFNGQISLGHGAFVLLGAYTTAILLDNKEQLGFIDSSPWPFWTTIFAAGIVGGLAGLVLGVPALRLTGPYLAIATLAFMISTPQVLRKYDGLTGGTQGLIIRQPRIPFGLKGELTNDQWMYLFCLAIAVLMLLVAWSVLRGPLGRAFVAVRDSEVAAAAMGINVARTKVIAFTISACYAGVAGSSLPMLVEVMTPDSVDILTSINFLTAIVIGGLASILGSVIGAAVLVFLPSDGPDLVEKLRFLPEELRRPG
ncbi:MAG: branched-chain amino acid ABC transporter permease, partial [Chloroflexota bacterium]